ncbi:GNAT family N-acetyltransferase [Heyndrickxia acidiproducens]|jgi:ribosomal-protein-serine acetyltransferase|uniref:GNAT family N-acetyltransferase n=1 Tax=Heyndrickxia acidiproducens TaxID=1121084 RepID=UPI00036744BB|nr:GNAT family protein [Heyndrickxia acidiproducens]
MFTYQIDSDVCLKCPALKDAEELFRLTDQSRRYLREWLPWVDGTAGAGDSAKFIQSCLADYAENKGMTAFLIFKGKIAGSISYNRIDWANKTAHIGYWLGEKFQGRGIMTKAAAAFTAFAFQDLQLNRVEIRAATGNVKSRAIPERLGFTNEGTIRQAEWLYDHFVDHVVYGMLASEWKTGMKMDN